MGVTLLKNFQINSVVISKIDATKVGASLVVTFNSTAAPNSLIFFSTLLGWDWLNWFSASTHSLVLE
jgi:hypothetical protein